MLRFIFELAVPVTNNQAEEDIRMIGWTILQSLSATPADLIHTLSG
jgi:hypothetical protein